MKMVKSLLLGTAAGLVAMSGAQAADLPVKAKPVQYVKICSLYGAGFYYIPGTDTCIKIGGYVRAEIVFNGAGSHNPYRAQNFDTPARDRQLMRARGMISADVRSQTEYGTLRSYILLGHNADNGLGSATTPTSFYGQNAFIQFAGFTAGQTISFFTFDTNPYANYTPYTSSDNGGTATNLFAYTAQLGNGLSASISAEDPTGRRTLITNAGQAVAATAAAYGGRRWTDLVGNVRVDQAWGSAQIMGAVHDVYGTNLLLTPTTASATGYALGAGLKVNLPMLGKGDYIQGQFTYAKGATRYLMVNSGAGGPAFALSSGFPAGGVPTNTALGYVTDAVFTGAAGTTAMDLTTGWNISGGYEHNWVPGWKTSIFGNYGKLDYSTAASLAVAAANGAGTAGSASWSTYQIGSRTVWTPVTNLDLSVEVVYSKVNTGFEGSTSATLGTYQDKGFWSGVFRAQRNFYN